MCDAAASWWPRQMKRVGPLAVERRSSSWSTSAEQVLESGLAAVEAARIVHGRIAALHDGREAGAQHVRQSLGILDAAAPDRVQDRVGVGDLLQHVGDVLRGADGFAARIDPDVTPGLDDGHALPVELRHLQQESEVLRALDDFLERRREAPVEESFAGEHVPAGKRGRRIPVAKEIPEQCVHGLRARGVLPEDARAGPPAEVLDGDVFRRACGVHCTDMKQEACHGRRAAVRVGYPQLSRPRADSWCARAPEGRRPAGGHARKQCIGRRNPVLRLEHDNELHHARSDRRVIGVPLIQR